LRGLKSNQLILPCKKPVGKEAHRFVAKFEKESALSIKMSIMGDKNKTQLTKKWIKTVLIDIKLALDDSPDVNF
jgi:hypothetical protein